MELMARIFFQKASLFHKDFAQ